MKTVLFSTEKSRKFLANAMLPVCAAILSVGLSPAAIGQGSVGLVGGIARDSASGKPIAEAQIIAHNLGKGTDRATVTNADGIFTFTSLEPGSYEVAASKNGFQKSAAHVEVAASRTARVDLPLSLETDVPRISSTASLTDREKMLLERIERLEGRLAAMEAKGTGAPQTAAAPAEPNIGGFAESGCRTDACRALASRSIASGSGASSRQSGYGSAANARCFPGAQAPGSTRSSR